VDGQAGSPGGWYRRSKLLMSWWPDWPPALGQVLAALGSSAEQHADLARKLAALFRADLVIAVQSTVHRALLSPGSRLSQD
jgi:hypothetical protein